MPPLLPRFLLTALCAGLFGLGCFVFAAEDKGSKTSKTGTSQYDVPEGTPDELLDFIKKQQESESSGSSRKARMAHLENVCQAIVTAAERIRGAEADDETLTAALKAEFEALSILKRLGDDDASKKLDTLTEKLKNDKRPAVAKLLKVQALRQEMEKLDTSDSEAVESFVSDFNKYISSATSDLDLAAIGQGVMKLLYGGDQQAATTDVGQALVRKLATSDVDDVVEVSAGLARLTGRLLENQGEEKAAAKLYRDVAKRLATSDKDSLREFSEELEGSAKKLELVGQPMPISGKLLDGGTFDISQFKGKVVLVDFWATWCGPCIAELPNVKDVYAKYHGRGFEVVGISLDSDVDDLTKFIKDEHIPWPILFEGGEDASGWEHPLAKKYGVSAIPMAVLIDRQGKVVTLSAQGERLAELVDELLGSKPASGADAEPVKKKAG